MKKNKTWSIKDEGSLNKNNIIFNDKMRRLIRSLERVNDNLGYYIPVSYTHLRAHETDS